jgi:hypothetical protein
LGSKGYPEASVVKVIDFSISYLRPLFIIEMIPTNRGVSLVVSFIAVVKI